MKKNVLFFLFLSLCSITYLFCYTTVNSSSAQTLNMGIDIPETELTERKYRDGNTYSSIILPNAGKLMVGKPDVPGLGNWILIPNGTNVSISTFPGTQIVYENIDLAPVQQDPFDNVESPLPPFEKDETIYSRNADYPGIFAEAESAKEKRGQSCTILWIYPYQYNPVKRTLTVYPDLEVSVNFNGVIKPIPSNLKSEKLIESLKGFAINAEEVLQAEESAEKIKSDRLERTDGCELLIISDPSFLGAANTLADWKTRRGIYTPVTSTSTTGTSTTSIENYINNAYDNWTPAPSYFLFIGDVEHIPVQYVTTTGTDFYYADRNNPTDWVADFGYGRLSVDTAAEADSLVARIIRYERSPSTNSSYYTDILNAACFQDGAGDPGIDGVADRRFCKTSEDVRNYLSTQQGYPWSQREYVAYNRVGSEEIFPRWWNDINQTGTYVFENDDPPNGGVEIPASMQKPTFPWDGNTAGISSAFNSGKFLALFRAHGGRSGWGDPDFYTTNVDALTNGEDRPIVWSITCQSGWFDGETSGYSTECFAEHWIRHNTGGSCGVLAATRNSFSGRNDRLIWGMMDAIWPGFTTWALDPYGGSTPIYRMGDIKNYGMGYMSTKYSGIKREETIRLFHWFGDPTMEMWTSQPSQLTSAYSTTNVIIGTSSMTVKVEPAVSGMLVCAYTDNADEIFATATTNSSGYAYLIFNNPLTIEPLVYVTITKHNYLPYEFTAGSITWEGDVSTDWCNSSNWSSNAVPSSSINVVIPSGTTHSPLITTGNNNCRDLIINSGATLTQTGTSYFNVFGYFDSDAGTFNQSGFSYLYFKGASSTHWDDDNEDDTYSYVRVDKSSDTASLSMWQNMTVENFEIRGGNFNIDGTWTLTVTSNSPYAFWVQDGGILTLQDETIDVLGDIEFSNGSQVNVSGGLIRCGSNLRVWTNTAYDMQFTGGIVEMYGSSAQYIYDLDGNTELFDLVINKSSGSCIVNNGDLVVRNDLTINNGILNSNNKDIYVGGDWTNNVGDSGFIEGTGTVIFNGTDFSEIATDETFYNLTLNSTSIHSNGLQLNYGFTATIINDLSIIDGKFELNSTSTLIVGNDVFIANGCGLNAYSDFGIEIYVGGDWTNNNSYWNGGLGYSPGTEVITFNGSSDQIITTQAPQEDFGNLVIDKSGGEFRPNDNIHVMHDFDILAGGWHDNTTSLTHYFEGDFYIAAGATGYWNSTTDNTVVFTGLSDQTVFNTVGVGYFRNIVINKTEWSTRNFNDIEGTESKLSDQDNINQIDDITETRNTTVTLMSDIDMQFGVGLTIEEGTLDLNGMTLNSMGDVVVLLGGTLVVDEGALLNVSNGNELSVYNGGVLEVLGTSGNLATISHRVFGNYGFNIYPGGMIKAEYVLFEYMDAYGVHVREEGVIDRNFSFNYCTFQNGFVGFGALLYINNADDVTITCANFPDDSSTDYNVGKTYEQGSISMITATGIFAGYDYELDEHSLIDWDGLPVIDDLTIHYNIVDNTIALNWTYPQIVDHFNIYRSTDPYEFLGAEVFTSYTESYSEPATGINYFYRITAENISDNGVTKQIGEYEEDSSNK